MFNLFRKRRTWKEHLDEGRRFGTASDLAQAEASFREAVRLAPEEPVPHYELGHTLFLMGRHAEALPELRRNDPRGWELVMCEEVLSGRLSQQGSQVLASFSA